ncbi:hypothetical protein Metlim_1985 [Methanoplanus limicola DSM 2279]|uniref:Uncharacterized protein n=1 Tax=Methanoplanus limicola DSM 2279 TaxID=937775 RepID=H1YZG5_9EURY|nr:hypothetical protein Metlim_1985 [Methanoplanus limicola DSM 2279]
MGFWVQAPGVDYSRCSIDTAKVQYPGVTAGRKVLWQTRDENSGILNLE